MLSTIAVAQFLVFEGVSVDRSPFDTLGMTRMANWYKEMQWDGMPELSNMKLIILMVFCIPNCWRRKTNC